MENNDYEFKKEHPRSADFRRKALERLKGNWQLALLVTLVWIVIVMGIEFILKFIGGQILAQLSFIITWPLSAGIMTIFLRICRGKEEKFGTLFCMFTSPSRFFKSIGISILVAVGSVVGFILLIIPGIWFSYTFSQSINVFIDDPNVGVIEAMKESSRLMKGEKWNLFKLQITFIGWWLLLFVGVAIVGVISIFITRSPITLTGINMLAVIVGITWLCPFFITALLSFYDFIKNDKGEKQIK